MNIPGILEISFYPPEKILFPELHSFSTVDLSIISTVEATRLNFIPESASVKVIDKLSEAGFYYDIVVSFDIEGNDIALLDQLKRAEYIYTLIDKSGVKWLIGHQHKPQLTYSMKNDKDGSGGRSISAEISWQTNIFPVFVA